MTLEELLVESSDMRRRHVSRTSCRYEYYKKSLEKYIPWMKEQINKSKEGFVRIKRGDLAIAMKKELAIIMGDRYRDITFNPLYDIIRIVLFNEGIFVELSHCDGERVFMMRNKIPSDSLTPGLARREKEIKGT